MKPEPVGRPYLNGAGAITSHADELLRPSSEGVMTGGRAEGNSDDLQEKRDLQARQGGQQWTRFHLLELLF